jgi:hypothetical protein
VATRTQRKTVVFGYPQDPRRQKLIAAVLADFERLAGEP